MTTHRHLASSYLHLLKVIHKEGGVPCENVPHVFFPEDIVEPESRAIAVKTAKALCHSCPIIEECMTYALETNQRYGIWGGTSSDER